MSNDLSPTDPAITVTNSQAPVLRPTIITGLCIVLGVAYPFALWKVLSGSYKAGGAWFPPFVFVSQLVALTAVFGYWAMRKWAIWIYAGFFIVSQTAIVVAGFWTFHTVLGPVCFIAVGVYYYRRMR